MNKRFLVFAVAALLTSGAAADEPFPFVLPWDDASRGSTDVSPLLLEPAGGRDPGRGRPGHGQ